MELAINSNICSNNDEFEALKVIKDKRFKNVFLWWGNGETEYNISKIELCKKLGLNIIFAHLDKEYVNAMWQDEPDGDRFVEDYEKQLEILGKYKIPIAIMHVQRSLTPPPLSKIGLERFKKIVYSAEKNGVVLAVENSWRLDYLDYVFGNISSEYLKICYDSGHNHAFTQDKFNFKKYGDKIVAIHLHDNDGTKDQHLLPFDGNIDFEKVLANIKASGYNGTLTLEIARKYGVCENMTLEMLLDQAKERGNELIKIYERV